VMHGPYAAKVVAGPPAKTSNTALLAEVGNVQFGQTEWADSTSRPATKAQLQISNVPRLGIKLTVRKSGFYRVSQADLVAAGVTLKGEARLLQMTVDGHEVPINVLTDANGEVTAVEFYGTGLDAAYNDARAYWLGFGNSPGLRIAQVQSSTIENYQRNIFY